MPTRRPGGHLERGRRIGAQAPLATLGNVRLPPGMFEWLAVTLVLVYVWRIQDLFGILGLIKFPILVSLAALWLFLDGRATRSAPRYRHRLVRISTFILVWMLFSVPGGVYPGLSLRFIVNDHVKTYIMMLMLIASIRQYADVERLILAYVLGAGLYCVEILTTFQIEASGRLGDLFYYDSNDLAMFLVCTLPLLVYFMRAGARIWLRLVALPIAGIFIITIVRAGSRGGFLGLIGVAIYLLFGFRAVAGRIRFGAVALCAILLFSVAGPVFWNMMGTMLKPEDDYNFNGTESGRQAIWQRGMGYMKSHPIAGVGANAFPQAEGMISELAGEQAEGHGVKWSAAHNSFVQIAAELGIPGIVAFIAQIGTMLMTCISLVRKRSRASPDEQALAQALIGTIIGYAICGFFLSQAYSAYLYATCAVLVGLSAVSGSSAHHPRTEALCTAPPRMLRRRHFNTRIAPG